MVLSNNEDSDRDTGDESGLMNPGAAPKAESARYRVSREVRTVFSGVSSDRYRLRGEMLSELNCRVFQEVIKRNRDKRRREHGHDGTGCRIGEVQLVEAKPQHWNVANVDAIGIHGDSSSN